MRTLFHCSRLFFNVQIDKQRWSVTPHHWIFLCWVSPAKFKYFVSDLSRIIFDCARSIVCEHHSHSHTFSDLETEATCSQEQPCLLKGRKFTKKIRRETFHHSPFLFDLSPPQLTPCKHVLLPGLLIRKDFCGPPFFPLMDKITQREDHFCPLGILRGEHSLLRSWPFTGIRNWLTWWKEHWFWNYGSSAY